MARVGKGKQGAKSKSMRTTPAKPDVPDIYRDMLADATTTESSAQVNDGGRPIKRRRVGGRIVTQKNDDNYGSLQSETESRTANDEDMDELFEDVVPNQQYIEQSASEDSADSDLNWEEVNLATNEEPIGVDDDEDPGDGQLHIVFDEHGDTQRSRAPGKVKRKPMTGEDKRLRLEIHKMHVCSLLAHVHLRNHWCNDDAVYTSMRQLLPEKTISYLNPDLEKSQFQRSRSFMDGLTQASEAFRGVFKVTARGMSKSKWVDSAKTLALLQPPDDIELPMQLKDFRDDARSLEASRDTGAQLFCAMLRAAGVDARLICSLQLLPFQSSQVINIDQVRPRVDQARKQRSREVTPGELSAAGTISDASIDPASPQVMPPKSATMPKKKRKPIRESKYPVYWVEAFNEAVQKWVPVDPTVTNSIAKPSKFEPPAGEPDNHMAYVIAFEDDGSARDVTKRYVKAYNAKTRRDRVEVTSGGEKWWKRVMKMYRRNHDLDRDQVEDAELAAKEAQEPMPRNVQDFKDHPYYALERHLRRHEVIHPKREVGKVGAGRSSHALESIYRRRDVHMVKSADKWYRLGREIKTGEQPLKRVPARRARSQSIDPHDPDAAEEYNAGTALYAPQQTMLYSAPPVKNGGIPKNVYGNLDVYVPSMVPPGGSHIPHPDVAKAARTLGIDYADAVTGFQFKGRHGTAITNGAVVASEYREAVEEVIQAFEDDRARVEEEKRGQEALRMWKRLLAGLRIRQRIEGYDIEGERGDSVREEMEKVDEDDDEDDGGGGFLPDRDVEDEAQPTAGRIAIRQMTNYSGDEAGGFLAEDEDEADTAVAQPDTKTQELSRPFANNFNDDTGGGFLINDSSADAEEKLEEVQANHPLGREGTADEETLNQSGDFIPSDTNMADTTPTQATEHPTIIKTLKTEPDYPANETTSRRFPGELDESAFTTNDANTRLENSMTDNKNDAPVLPDSELKEARMVQQLRDTRTIPQPRSPPQDEAMIYTPNPHDASTSKFAEDNEDPPLGTSQKTGSIRTDGTIQPDQPTQPTQPTQSSLHTTIEDQVAEANSGDDDDDDDKSEVAYAGESSGEDKGSLLSHDPEDEDAEPEWLA